MPPCKVRAGKPRQVADCADHASSDVVFVLYSLATALANTDGVPRT